MDKGSSQPTKSFTPPVVGEVIPHFNRNYIIGSFIGSGAFGDVYECTDEWGNKLVAKVLKPNGAAYEEIRANWERELTNLLQLRHPNITFLYAAFEYRDSFYLIMERCAFSLEKLIAFPTLMPHRWVLPVARCVLQAVDFMHTFGYVHKDLHPGNIFTSFIPDELLGESATATVFKVGDLGISRLIPDIDWFNTRLAQWMLPPEFLNTKEFGPLGAHVDIYHAGLLLLALLNKSVPQFTTQQILDGAPRTMAESLDSPFAGAIARSLRRHVLARTPTALDFWRELVSAGNAA